MEGLLILLALFFVNINSNAQSLFDHLKLVDKRELSLPGYLDIYNSTEKVLTKSNLIYLNENRDSLISLNFVTGIKKPYVLEPGYHKSLFLTGEILAVENSLAINKNSLSIYKIESDTLLFIEKKITKKRTETVDHRNGKTMIFYSDFESNSISTDKDEIKLPNTAFYYIKHLGPSKNVVFTALGSIFIDQLNYLIYFTDNKGKCTVDSSMYSPIKNEGFLCSVLKKYSKRNPKSVFDDLDTLLKESLFIWDIRLIKDKFLLVKKSIPNGTKHSFFYDILEIENNRCKLVFSNLFIQHSPPPNSIIGTDIPEFADFSGVFSHYGILNGDFLLILKQDIPMDLNGLIYSDYKQKRDDYFMHHDPVFKVFVYEFNF